MKTIIKVLVALLALLALLSGLTKVMLVQRETEFFGAFGIDGPLLVVFGLAQVLGAVLLVVPRTRRLGAAIVGLTFLLSAVFLFMAGDSMTAIVTLVAVLGLGLVAKQSGVEEGAHRPEEA